MTQRFAEILNWRGMLRHWLRKGGGSPPWHWVTADGRPRCAACGEVLTAEDPIHRPRTAPRCRRHEYAVTMVIAEECAR